MTPGETNDTSTVPQQGESLAWIQDVVRDLVGATTPEQFQRATSLLAGWEHLPDTIGRHL